MVKRLLLILAVWGAIGANAANHSLTYQATASSGAHDFPEYVEVGLVDGVEFIHYDSNSSRAEPKQDWMTRLTADRLEYLKTETRRCRTDQRDCKNLMRHVQERLQQTGGVHTLQVMHGCEWDDETGEVRGHYRYAYDGEDFIAFDLKTRTWIAANPHADVTKQQWDKLEGHNMYLRYYLKTQCPDHLKKFLDYGNSSLLRTELPSVSLLQKTPFSPIVCHATGFYPLRAKLFWTKDGEELHDDVDIGEVLPNLDGTFQMMAQLKLPDPSEAWERYTCVFQLDGVNTSLTTLDKEAILTNWKPEDRTVPIIAGSVAVVLLVAAAAVIGVIIRAVTLRERSGGSSSFDSSSDSTSDSMFNPSDSFRSSRRQAFRLVGATPT